MTGIYGKRGLFVVPTFIMLPIFTENLLRYSINPVVIFPN